jgi:hypothetical protein
MTKQALSAPIDLTADVSAVKRPVRDKCLGGPSFV